MIHQNCKDLLDAIIVGAWDRLFDAIAIKIWRDRHWDWHLVLSNGQNFQNAIELFRELGWNWIFRDGSPASIALQKRAKATAKIRADYRRMEPADFARKYHLLHPKDNFGLYSGDYTFATPYDFRVLVTPAAADEPVEAEIF